MKVTSVQKITIDKDYSKEVTDHNIYIDTDSVFFSAVPIMDYRWKDWKSGTDNEIADKVNLVAGEVQDYLNSFYDILADKILNVQEHRLEIKKEYVIKAGLWVKKKRYAQWIISDNGVPCDKLDVKGLDVKRSSFPSSFQKIMSDVLIDILRNKPESEITDHVAEFKKSMKSIPIVEIAKNSAVKNLKKYMPKGKRQLFHIMKGTPAHVKAAIMYNDLLVHFKSPFKYQPMKGGDKIKWAYLKTNPLGIEGLGFTGYQDPPEITEFISTYIDHEKIFERELHHKLQDFYNAIGWGDVMSQEKTASQFFSF